jgi:hypothetical protein
MIVRRALFKGTIATFCGATLAAVTSGRAAADNFAPESGIGSSSLDFDTADGNYSKWRMDSLGTLNAVRTTMRIDRLGYDPRWLPFLGIAVINGDEGIAFRIIALEHKTPLAISLTHFQKNEVADEHKFSTTLDLNEKLDVAISWTSDGALTAKVANEEPYTLRMKPIASLQLSGSTCDGKFDPLQIGRLM